MKNYLVISSCFFEVIKGHYKDPQDFMDCQVLLPLLHSALEILTGGILVPSTIKNMVNTRALIPLL